MLVFGGDRCIFFYFRQESSENKWSGYFSKNKNMDQNFTQNTKRSRDFAKSPNKNGHPTPTGSTFKLASFLKLQHYHNESMPKEAKNNRKKISTKQQDQSACNIKPIQTKLQMLLTEAAKVLSGCFQPLLVFTPPTKNLVSGCAKTHSTRSIFSEDPILLRKTINLFIELHPP